MDSFFVVCFCSLFSCIVGSKIFLVTIDIDMRSIFIFPIDIDLRSVFLYPPSISTLSHTKIPTLAARSSPLAFAFRHSSVLITNEGRIKFSLHFTRSNNVSNRNNITKGRSSNSSVNNKCLLLDDQLYSSTKA